MSRIPTKTIYDLGRDRHGRTLELIVEASKFTLHRHAANQRDDDVWLEIAPHQAIELREALK